MAENNTEYPKFALGRGSKQRNMCTLLQWLWRRGSKKGKQSLIKDAYTILRPEWRDKIDQLESICAIRCEKKKSGRGMSIASIALLKKPEEAFPEFFTDDVEDKARRDIEDEHTLTIRETEILHRLRGDENLKRERRTIVLVDAANVTGRKAHQELERLIESVGGDEDREELRGKFLTDESRLVGTLEISFPALMARIMKGYDGNAAQNVCYAGIYLFAHPSHGYYRKAVAASAKRGSFEVVFHEKPDVDPLLSADIIDYGRDELEDLTEGDELTIVLVSGDIDFAYAVKNLQRRAEAHGVRLNVWLISWEKSLNRKWIVEELASAVTYIDLLPTLMNENARRRVEEEQWKLAELKRFRAKQKERKREEKRRVKYTAAAS